jgi:hypothetical protein
MHMQPEVIVRTAEIRDEDTFESGQLSSLLMPPEQSL